MTIQSNETGAVNNASAGADLGSAGLQRRPAWKSTLQAGGMVPILIFLGIAFELMSGRFFSVQNLSIVAQQASINIVLAAGMTFVILTGGIDLSVGSLLAASALGAVSRSTPPQV